MTFQVLLPPAGHLTLIAKATRLTLLLLRGNSGWDTGHRAQAHAHTCAEADRGERPGQNHCRRPVSRASYHRECGLWSQAARVPIPALPLTPKEILGKFSKP